MVNWGFIFKIFILGLHSRWGYSPWGITMVTGTGIFFASVSLWPLPCVPMSAVFVDCVTPFFLRQAFSVCFLHGCRGGILGWGFSFSAWAILLLYAGRNISISRISSVVINLVNREMWNMLHQTVVDLFSRRWSVSLIPVKSQNNSVIDYRQ